MGFFYFDDSVHDDAGFIAGCMIYSEDDLNAKVYDALVECDMNPEEQEYKSGNRFYGNERLIQLREKMQEIFHSTKIGLAFVPREKRDSLYIHGLHLLYKIIENNDLSSKDHKAFFDEGIYNHQDHSRNLPIKYVELFCQQDSKNVRGIQVADLIAHTCSMMLKGTLGQFEKKKEVGLEYGYEPEMLKDGLMDLDYFLWATIRRNFFQGINGVKEEDMMSGHTNMIDYGLVISDDFKQDFRNHIKERFAYNYLGCIH